MRINFPFGLGSREPLPTSQLYGLEGHFPRAPTKSVMGDAYRVGNQVVLVRCAAPHDGPEPAHLLIDDDMEAAIADTSLPAGYRARLEQSWRKSAAATCMDRICSVIVPSTALERKYLSMGKKVHRIDPWWPVPAEYPSCDEINMDSRDVAFLGTGSHVGDLEDLKSALRDSNRSWRFHHFLGPHSPKWLQQLRDVVAHKPMSWRKYCVALPQLRFPICVYPARATAVNQARSCNKFLEHAMTASVALYGQHIPFSQMISSIDPSLLVAAEDWKDAIQAIIESPERRRRLARASHNAAARHAALARIQQREIWAQIAQGF